MYEVYEVYEVCEVLMRSNQRRIFLMWKEVFVCYVFTGFKLRSNYELP